MKGLGDNPITVQFRLDNDAVIEVAAEGEGGNFAQGPFFTKSSELETVNEETSHQVN